MFGKDKFTLLGCKNKTQKTSSTKVNYFISYDKLKPIKDHCKFSHHLKRKTADLFAFLSKVNKHLFIIFMICLVSLYSLKANLNFGVCFFHFSVFFLWFTLGRSRTLVAAMMDIRHVTHWNTTFCHTPIRHMPVCHMPLRHMSRFAIR